MLSNVGLTLEYEVKCSRGWQIGKVSLVSSLSI